jgi:predicted RNase H-like HicB family nuclease
VARRREAARGGKGKATEYLALIEQDGGAWGAYVPDLPGSVAVARSRDEVELLIAEAIPMHLASLREHGQLVPAPAAVGSMTVGVKRT